MPRCGYIVLSVLLFLAPIAGDAAPDLNQPLPVKWQNNSINLEQLQAIFMKNPGVQQYVIQFPNGLNWNVNQRQLLDAYGDYLQRANAIGGNAPKLVFSSLENKVESAGNTTMIPIDNAISGIRNETQNMLDNVDYNKAYLAQYLPDWLNDVVAAVFDAVIQWYHAVVDWFKKHG